MGRRIALFSIIILVSGLAILGYFLQQGRKVLLTDPYKAIPATTSIIIESPDLQSFISNLTADRGLSGELSKVKEFSAFNSGLKYLDGQLKKSSYSRLINGTPALIAFIFSEGKLQPLLSTAVSGEIRLKQLKEILQDSGIKTIDEEIVDGNSIFRIPYTLGDARDTAHMSLVSGLLLCSTSGKILTGAIGQLSSEAGIKEYPGFARIMQASGKNNDKIYLFFANLKSLLGNIFNDSINNLAGKTITLANCAEGDIFTSDNGMILSGYTECTDSSEILSKYKTRTPGVLHTFRILPSSTALFQTMIREDGIVRNNPGKYISRETSEAASKIREFLGKEITRAYLDIRSQPADENSIIIFDLNNRTYAEKIIADGLEARSGSSGIQLFQPDDQTRIPVYHTPWNGLSSLLAPESGYGFDDSWIAFYDNFMIMGNSYNTLSRVIYDNILNRTLTNDLTFRDFKSTLPSVSGYFFYCVPSRITGYLAGYLNAKIISGMKNNMASLSKIQAVGYQFTPSNDMLYNSLSVQFKDEAREETGTEWETLLDTTAAVKPFFFTNHNTGAKEIFIQDLKNNAYLINAAGRVLWKVPLRERITGNIYMIDYYRNGKYQLLFSGKNYLHLLDRNGNYVERYPVKLRSPGTNSLALFDYDNNRNYRLFIGGEDKKIYAYDKSGSTVKGWKPFAAAGIVESEICWFRVSGKDYLVASDQSSIYFLDRTGNRRLTPGEPVSRARGSALRLIPGNDPSVVCTSADGTIQYIYFNGDVKKYVLKKFSVDHSFDIFDINGDGFGEYIFIDKGILYLYDHNRNEIFSRDFGSKHLGGPIDFIFSASDRKIGVFDIDKNLIYLIDGEGKIMNGFPLRGASMFSIGKMTDNGGWHLIVGGSDRFLYNYKLNAE